MTKIKLIPNFNLSEKLNFPVEHEIRNPENPRIKVKPGHTFYFTGVASTRSVCIFWSREFLNGFWSI